MRNEPFLTLVRREDAQQAEKADKAQGSSRRGNRSKEGGESASFPAFLGAFFVSGWGSF